MNEVESLLIAAGFRHHFNGVTVGWFKRITILRQSLADEYFSPDHQYVVDDDGRTNFGVTAIDALRKLAAMVSSRHGFGNAHPDDPYYPRRWIIDANRCLDALDKVNSVEECENDG